MTEQELIDKYDLTSHPMWTVGVGVWCQSIHHEEPFEKTTEPGKNRLLYVASQKPEHERAIRFAAMRLCADQGAVQTLYDDYEAKRKPLYVGDWYDWVPVSKVPPRNDDYLAFFYLGPEEYGVDKTVYAGGKWISPFADGITHWMPLPEPPTQEKL